jgi:hypothetical protein
VASDTITFNTVRPFDVREWLEEMGLLYDQSGMPMEQYNRLR